MERLSLKRQLGKIWPAKKNNRKVILLYHSVNDSPWGLAKNKFQEQIKWLSDHCQILSLSELIHAKENSNIQVAITFDDGYRSLYETVAPLLTTKKIKPTVYINTGWISNNEEERKKSNYELGHYPDEHFLIWNEVKELYSQGDWEIGSHGVNHHNFKLIEKSQVLIEFTQSKKQIEQELNILCTHFSYPFGKYTQQTKQIVKLAGYQYATSVRHGPIHASSDLYALPRINVDRNYTLEDFKQVIQGSWDYIGLIHKIRGQ